MYMFAGMPLLLHAAAGIYTEGLQLLAGQQQQQQATQAAHSGSSSSSPGSSSGSSSNSSMLLRSTASLSRTLLELYNGWVSAAVITPAAVAAANGRKRDCVIDYSVLLLNPFLMMAVQPMAELALALLRTPVSNHSSSSSSSSDGSSSRGGRSSSTALSAASQVQMTMLSDWTARQRKPELDAIAVAATQYAKAVTSIKLSKDLVLPAAVLQLLMVNLAYAVQREQSSANQNQRQQQQQLAHRCTGSFCAQTVHPNG
jgi:hypothetical protein